MPDVQTTWKDFKLDRDVSNKHNDLYAWAWYWENERPVYDTDYDNTATLGSRNLQNNLIQQLKKRVMHQEPHEKFSLGSVPQTDGLCDGTDTYSPIEPDAETSSEQYNSTPTNPRCTKDNLSHNPKPNGNDHFRY